MKQIRITRSSDGTVEFETVTVDETENVFFRNLDKETHWPTISENKVPPSKTSSQCFPESEYGCQMPGHEHEKGFITILEAPE